MNKKERYCEICGGKIKVDFPSSKKRTCSKPCKNVNIGKYVVDFVRDNHVVEVFGDYWHCNPVIFSPDYYNQSIQMTAAEKWEYDNIRTQHLEADGYYVTILWEKDISPYL